MAPKASSNLRGQLLSIVLAALCISLADCKPLEAPKKFDAASEGRSDPLLAMPSEYSPSQGPHEVAYVAQPQVHYIVQHEPQAEPNQQQAAELGAPQQEQPRQEVSYVLVKSESGAAQSQPDTPVEEDCNQREANEYAAAQGQSSEGRQEYPGEIVYVSQNGENRQAVEGQQQEPESLGSAMSQSSGMPATILTEIPVKDMPYEVLEKLRREYGVKVVATRDRPGANLVINCDDYTGHGQTICSRQAAAQSDGLYPTNLAASPVEEQASGYLRRELASSILHTTSDALESPDVRYVTSDANSGASGEAAPQPDSQGYREAIGSKAYLALDQAEPTQPERHVETSSSLVDSGAEEKSDVQPENETHDSGFEAQPVAGVHEAESRQVGKRVGSQ